MRIYIHSVYYVTVMLATVNNLRNEWDTLSLLIIYPVNVVERLMRLHCNRADQS